MTWQPLVTGAARGRYVDRIAELAAARRGDDLDALSDHALARTYLASDGTLAEDADDDALGAAIELLVAQPDVPNLFGGAARVGFTIAHVAGGEEADAACSVIDRIVRRHVETWQGDYDLISGLVGFGVYALERGDLALATAVVDQLGARATEREGGAAWHTAPELLWGPQRAEAPDGYWNLGLAHGMPGVVAYLGRCVAAGVPTARPLLARAVAYLLAIAPMRRYPAWLPGSPSPRLAWCYGDLGVAVALLGAGLHAAVPEWRDEGLALARDCATRSPAEAAVTNAGICHGAAGVAHQFLRMANATHDALLASAARSWLDRSFDLPVEPGPLLTGAPGIALVLHAAISSVEPLWDRLLLGSLPTIPT